MLSVSSAVIALCLWHARARLPVWHATTSASVFPARPPSALPAANTPASSLLLCGAPECPGQVSTHTLFSAALLDFARTRGSRSGLRAVRDAAFRRFWLCGNSAARHLWDFAAARCTGRSARGGVGARPPSAPGQHLRLRRAPAPGSVRAPPPLRPSPPASPPPDPSASLRLR